MSEPVSANAFTDVSFMMTLTSYLLELLERRTDLFNLMRRTFVTCLADSRKDLLLSSLLEELSSDSVCDSDEESLLDSSSSVSTRRVGFFFELRF